MKKLTYLITFLLITTIVFSQTENFECVSCESNEVDFRKQASAIGKYNSSGGNQSFAGGLSSQAMEDFSFAFGSHVTAVGGNSFALGRFAETSTSSAMVLGFGANLSEKLINDIPNSLVIGFNSTKPTFFIGMSDGAESTGKVGIGNITDPQAKLHIKADAGKDAVMFIEPHAWSSGLYGAEIRLGNVYNVVSGQYGAGLVFKTYKNYLFNSPEANVGIGTSNPFEKLEVNGKIKSSGSNSALILESPDGTEWEITIDNNGNLSTNQIAIIHVEQNQYSIKIFPNPVKNTISIEIHSEKIHSFDAEIYDLNGKMIFMRNYKSNNSTIDVKSFSKGTYILKINGETGKVLKSEKIVIDY